MNKEKLIRLHYLCAQLGATANALIAIAEFPKKVEWLGSNHVPMNEEDKLTKILEVLEEAYKIIREDVIEQLEEYDN